MNITKNELGKTVEFLYTRNGGETWENKTGIVSIASKKYETFLLGTIVYYTQEENPHLKNIKLK